MEPDAESEVETAWNLGMRERIKRYDARHTVGVGGAEVFAELDKKLKR